MKTTRGSGVFLLASPTILWGRKKSLNHTWGEQGVQDYTVAKAPTVFCVLHEVFQWSHLGSGSSDLMYRLDAEVWRGGNMALVEKTSWEPNGNQCPHFLAQLSIECHRLPLSPPGLHLFS